MPFPKILLSALALCSVLSAQPTVRFATNVGNIDVILTPSVAPITVANFLNYVNSGAYVNTIIHRSVPGFVIQGGGFTYVPGAFPTAIAQNATIQNEFNVTNARGTIAMAQPANSPNGATNQWFFNLANNGSQLDTSTNGPFTVFGHVVNAAGLTIMDRIAALPTSDLSSTLSNSAFTNVPLSGTNLVVVSSISQIPALTATGFQSAASFASSSLTGIAPGEFVVIYGQSLGPANLTTFTVTDGAISNSLAGTQVFFNGKPAPIIYTSSGQVSVIAPAGISILDTVTVSVSYQGVQSSALVFPVVSANPAVFTLNASGSGDGAIVRLDGSIVSTASPAQVGDTLELFGEGYGAATDATTLPDGAIISTKLPVPADPKTALLIDGNPVPTLYFGGALVNGAFQINFKVPQLTPGAHKVQVQVGTRTSPAVNLQTK